MCSDQLLQLTLTADTLTGHDLYVASALECIRAIIVFLELVTVLLDRPLSLEAYVKLCKINLTDREGVGLHEYDAKSLLRVST